MNYLTLLTCPWTSGFLQFSIALASVSDMNGESLNFITIIAHLVCHFDFIKLKAENMKMRKIFITSTLVMKLVICLANYDFISI